jgi:hypothetical protein
VITAHTTALGAVRAVVVTITVVALWAGVAGAAARAPGTGVPPAGSGINTPAALTNPECDHSMEPYGQLDFIVKGGGPFCVTKWQEGEDNGGATYPGVTKTKITVVALVPNEQQMAQVLGPQKPVNYATGGVGTVQDVLSDGLAAYEHVFGRTYMYGRDIELQFVTSTGIDEAAQRADALSVQAKHPFVVLDNANGAMDVFDAALVRAKIPVFSLFVTVAQTLKQAPYRWGQQDPIAGSINTAEFIGKQLKGRKASYAGDPTLRAGTRTFGVVQSDVLDISYFNQAMSTYGVEVAPGAVIKYPGTTSSPGDATVAQQYAPTIVTKLKSAGVTTVVLLADGAMTAALTKQATTQNYHPEWIYAGSFNIDFPTLARATYDQEEWAHAFGLSNVFPGSPDAPTTVPNPVQWYWGPGKGTYQVTYVNALSWLVAGIMYAGPKLTPETLKQGFFAVPASGGSASHDPETANQGVRFGYGRTNGLPYVEYTRGNKDFAATWWDPDTVGPPTLGFPGGKGAVMYLDDARRYYAGQWPTKPLRFFDKADSLSQFDAPATQPQVLPCQGCPSDTGIGTPGAH